MTENELYHILAMPTEGLGHLEKHSYVYDKASGTEGYVSTEYLNFLRNQRK